jgi:hypothetical protein
MCLIYIKNIRDIHYPENCENLHNIRNYILVENEPIRQINFNLAFKVSKIN